MKKSGKIEGISGGENVKKMLREGEKGGE